MILTRHKLHWKVPNCDTRERENHVGDVTSHDRACDAEIRHVRRLAMGEDILVMVERGLKHQDVV